LIRFFQFLFVAPLEFLWYEIADPIWIIQCGVRAKKNIRAPPGWSRCKMKLLSSLDYWSARRPSFLVAIVAIWMSFSNWIVGWFWFTTRRLVEIRNFLLWRSLLVTWSAWILLHIRIFWSGVYS
jgi:hypothetical protein